MDADKRLEEIRERLRREQLLTDPACRFGGADVEFLLIYIDTLQQRCASPEWVREAMKT